MVFPWDQQGREQHHQRLSVGTVKPLIGKGGGFKNLNTASASLKQQRAAKHYLISERCLVRAQRGPRLNTFDNPMPTLSLLNCDRLRNKFSPTGYFYFTCKVGIGTSSSFPPAPTELPESIN